MCGRVHLASEFHVYTDHLFYDGVNQHLISVLDTQKRDCEVESEVWTRSAPGKSHDN
jgi:hypothetical protein